MGDVFISYAHIDDRPLAEGERGWVSRFHRTLGIKLAQLLGEEPSIWRDPKLSGNDVFDDTIGKRLPEAKALISVLTPRYAKSEWCVREALDFHRAAEARGGVRVGEKSRIFKVVKTPVAPADLPPDLSAVFDRLLGFDFFDLDPETGRVREFDEAFGEAARQRYYEKVYDLAFELSQLLKADLAGPGSALAPAPAAAPPAGPSPAVPAVGGFDAGVPATAADVPELRGAPVPAAAGAVQPGGAAGGGKTVYLATATTDLADGLDRIRRELLERGHRVIPAAPLPLVAAELETAVKAALAESDFAVHLLGENYGLVPEGTSESLVELQCRWAAERSAEAGLRRVLWAPAEVAPSDPRQTDFLARVRDGVELLAGAELMEGTLAALKSWIVQELAPPPPRPAARAAAEAPAGEPGQPQVYLICDPKDEEAVEGLEDFLFDQGLEVSLPEFGAGDAEVGPLHREQLQVCDAVLVFYGAARRSWVDIKLRDVVKANGYGRSAPLAAQAVYIAPPEDRRKERFRSHSAEVIHGGSAFNPDRLAPFVERVKGVE